MKKYLFIASLILIIPTLKASDNFEEKDATRTPSRRIQPASVQIDITPAFTAFKANGSNTESSGGLFGMVGASTYYKLDAVNTTLLTSVQQLVQAETTRLLAAHTQAIQDLKAQHQ